ncbi:hypothetical protein QA601_02600 [Chitinispirillales bacterium ANBcel5]|uniref:hypothetical protein n=1 Tax=Cellulosispirillum alkaliphilum TaxID=3039283 RepID=UPI002A4F56C4|nr:hypothetical protein [Chitinispirillales bacterium ANBcel5]
MYARKSIVITILMLLFTTVFSREVCELVIESCPEDFSDDTIFVSEKVVALSSSVRACEYLEVLEDVYTDPPSIMFVIDHSTSMYREGFDPQGSRFTVTTDLITMLYRTIPNAEIGLAPFRRFLFFDHRNYDYMVNLPLGRHQEGAYMPLLTLNQRYPCGRLGHEILIDILETEVTDVNTGTGETFYDVVDLVYQPLFDAPFGTNINSGFDAAKDAFSNTDNSKENHFIIFLSDGEANRPQYGNPREFVAGTDVPTTFTVFFAPEGNEAPEMIVEMTENVRNSGYTQNNIHSDLWTIQTNHDILLDLLQNQILTPILKLVTGTPVTIAVNRTFSDTVGDSSTFIFTHPFPLQDTSTQIEMVIDYEVRDDDTGQSGSLQTKTDFTVIRKPNAPVPDGFSLVCWERPDLSLRYREARVNIVHEYMDTLEVVFDPGSKEFEEVGIELSNFEQRNDLEMLNLTRANDGTWVGTFGREISENALRGDGTLQHRITDSIVVTYRNPEIPLDTIRVSVPFRMSRFVESLSAAYFDINADGFIDSIFIGLSDPLSDDDLMDYVDRLQLPVHRMFSVDSVSTVAGGIALHVTEQGSTIPQTSVTEFDVITVTGGMSEGAGYINPAELPAHDSVAPVITGARLLQGVRQEDTLVVTFSEHVREINDDQPFLFSTPYAQNYRAALSFLDGEGDQMRFLVEDIRGVQDMTSNDSIWINFEAGVSDLVGNAQLNPRNRRALLEVIPPPFNLDVKVINNPMDPANSPIPDFVKNVPGYNAGPRGLVIIVEPTIDIRFALEGTVHLYDVVKNPVAKIDEGNGAFFDENQNRLYFVWNGRNENGRNVGTGTYQAVIKVTGSDTVKETVTVRVGVRR